MAWASKAVSILSTSVAVWYLQCGVCMFAVGLQRSFRGYGGAVVFEVGVFHNKVLDRVHHLCGTDGARHLVNIRANIP